MKNPLLGIKKAGQSVWIDYLSRDLIQTGKLERMVEKDGVTGVTTNPSIFQRAIAGSGLYDAQIRELVSHGTRREKEIFLKLAMKDVGEAADVLMPVYEKTKGGDGFVSIEVSPDLAYQPDATVGEAVRLFKEIGRKNVLVKVPATRPGLEAIERLTSAGVNVNVTLLFSAARYVEVADSYMRGIVRRINEGGRVDEIVSVASFFVSRVDTLVDNLLDNMIKRADKLSDVKRLKGLRGRAAVASARLAYQRYLEIASGHRYRALSMKGARMQRLLWGSTGAKDPAYKDVKYVEELICRDSINTMPEETMKAFRDHGVVEATIEKDKESLAAFFDELASVGIDIEAVADTLEEEGVKKFSDSWLDALAMIAAKRDAMTRHRAA